MSNFVKKQNLDKKVTSDKTELLNIFIHHKLVLSNTSKLICRLQKCLHHEMLNEILNVTNLSKYKIFCCNSSNDSRLPIENLFCCFQPR